MLLMLPDYMHYLWKLRSDWTSWLSGTQKCKQEMGSVQIVESLQQGENASLCCEWNMAYSSNNIFSLEMVAMFMCYRHGSYGIDLTKLTFLYSIRTIGENFKTNVSDLSTNFSYLETFASTLGNVLGVIWIPLEQLKFMFFSLLEETKVSYVNHM